MKNIRKYFLIIKLISVFCFLYSFSFSFTAQSSLYLYPVARAGHNMVYNLSDGEIILFGGMKDNLNNQESYLNDTWIYDYSNNVWTNPFFSIYPPNRNGPGMVYEPINNRVILFGGANQFFFLNDTWELDLNHYLWHEIDSTTSPPGSADSEMFFDELNQEIVFFGGYTAIGYSNETWIFDISSDEWIKQNHTIHPSSRYGHRIVYSSSKDSGILFAGHAFGSLDTINNDMWQYNCSIKHWSEMTVDSPPPTRYWHDMIYDEVNEKIIMFGGRKNSYSFECWGDTWEYTEENNQWTEIKTNQSPEPRMFCSMVYNKQAKKIIMFGGNQDPNTTIFNDLWEYDTNKNTWKQIVAGKKVSNISIIALIGVLSLLGIISIIRKKSSSD